MFEAFKPLKYRILYIPRKLANFASHRIKVFARKQCALGTLYICFCSSLSLQLLQGLQDSALSIYCPHLHGTNYSVAGKVQDETVKEREGRQEREEARILMLKPTWEAESESRLSQLQGTSATRSSGSHIRNTCTGRGSFSGSELPAGIENSPPVVRASSPAGI